MPQPAATDFLTANDALVARRDAHNDEIAQRRTARDAIADPLTREIALHFSRGEKHGVKLAHLQDLGHLALGTDGPIEGASDRVNLALDRARAQGNFSAGEALERELDRDRDEEEHALTLALMEHA